ncbi:hypothetical protein Celaphus_00017879 [Cervus elaphus hippelaphus]|uniref:Uncharacterized protein n=1 Tax=Cervus elaphus hippelaphus TaxID=46360 RepID=A0A212C8E2_CEREH|nr:hypothetical protein Celaphus_00017879 [Cervus elaphus hippelaphus]
MLCEQYYLVPPELEVEEFSAKAPNKPIQHFQTILELQPLSNTPAVGPGEHMGEVMDPCVAAKGQPLDLPLSRSPATVHVSDAHSKHG